MKNKKKYLLITMSALVTLAILTATQALAEDKHKYQGKVYMVGTESHYTKLDDRKGHIFGLGVSRGVDIVNNSIWENRGVVDHVRGTGDFHGWSKISNPDGAITYMRYEGQMKSKALPEGGAKVFMTGTWKITGGTGKWDGARGEGTFDGHFMGQGIYTYDMNGEYTLKK